MPCCQETDEGGTLCIGFRMAWGPTSGWGVLTCDKNGLAILTCIASASRVWHPADGK